MKTRTAHQRNADLDRLMQGIRELQCLDGSVEANRHKALAECRRMLGALARYRHLLTQREAWAELQQRQAA